MRRSRARALLVVSALPALIAWVGVLVLLHAPGVPERFFLLFAAYGEREDVSAAVGVLVGLGAVMPFVGIAHLAFGHRSAPGKARMAAATTNGFSAGVVAFVLSSAFTQQQVGAEVQHLAIALWAWVGVGAGAFLGAALAGSVPRASLVAGSSVPADAVRTPLRADESQVCTGWTRCRWWIYALELLVIVPGCFVFVSSGTWGLLPVVVAPALVTVVASTTFRVTVGEAGLVLTSLPLSALRIHVPLEHVVRADVVGLSPWSNGGSWGYRPTSEGAVVITRRGLGVQVERGDGSLLGFSVDDPYEVAALLNTLADRRRSAATVAA